MDGFCPLCAKSGIRRRVKAFQINLEEAVWACESEECIWPFDYEDLKFFARPAISCTWEEPKPVEEDNASAALTELSLYTPPVTPGQKLSKEQTEIASAEYSSNPPMEDKVGTFPKCEFIMSPKESTGSNKSPLFEPLELEGVNCTKGNDSLMNEQIVGVNISKALPRITSIKKTNIDLKIFSNTGEYVYCDNRKVQTQLPMNATVTNTSQNLDLSDSGCTELDLNMLCKIESEQCESGKLQSKAMANGVESHFTLSESTKMLVDVDGTNSLNTTESIANVSCGDIRVDTLLEEIINNKGHLTQINEDWLNSLMS